LYLQICVLLKFDNFIITAVIVVCIFKFLVLTYHSFSNLHCDFLNLLYCKSALLASCRIFYCQCTCSSNFIICMILLVEQTCLWFVNLLIYFWRHRLWRRELISYCDILFICKFKNHQQTTNSLIIQPTLHKTLHNIFIKYWNEQTLSQSM